MASKRANGEFKIDKGVPMPKRTGLGSTPKYPWKSMKVGDSFHTGPRDKPLGSVSAAGPRHGMKFSQRREGNGYRVWRME